MPRRLREFLWVVGLAGVAALAATASAPALASVESRRTVSVETQPYDVVVAPNGERAWTTHSVSANILGFTTEATPQLHGAWHLPGVQHTQLAIAPDSVHALVAARLSGSVYSINLQTGEFEAVSSLQIADPASVAFSHDGRFAAVGYYGNSQVVVVDTADWSVVHTWPMSAGVSTVLFTPDDTAIFAILQDESRVVRLNPSDPASTSTFTTGSDPWGAAFSPDGQILYLGLETGQGVAVHDTDTGFLRRFVATGSLTRDVDVSPDGTQVWVTNPLNNSVTVMDSVSEEVIDSIEVTGAPVSLDFSPNGCQVWVTQSQANTDTVFTLSPCLANPDPDLPNTGVDTMSRTVAGGLALGVLTAGAAMLVLRRYTS